MASSKGADEARISPTARKALESVRTKLHSQSSQLHDLLQKLATEADEADKEVSAAMAEADSKS